MDYTEAFKNLRANNKYGRKSPHKAVLMLTVIELFEKNILTDNEIFYDDKLKSMFLKVWNKVLPDEPLFHSDAYLPFWYLQNDSFWHIVPIRGKEDILSLMRDNNVKPSETKLNDSVRCAELDDDLYFLMTLQSGRSSLKRVLLETYTQLSENEIDRLSVSMDNTVDYSATAMSEYEKILSQGNDDMVDNDSETDKELVSQFRKLSEDVQIELNLQYYSYLKKHRSEREVFKELFPSVYDLLDNIVNHPFRQGEIAPSFVFDYENFLSDLKISLMSADGAVELIDKIGEALELLRGKITSEDSKSVEEGKLAAAKELIDGDVEPDDTEEVATEETAPEIFEVEHVFLDRLGNVTDTITTSSVKMEPDNRRGKPWTKEEEDQIKAYFGQGMDVARIGTFIGRSELAVNMRLAKLGLINYTYGQEEKTLAEASQAGKKKAEESDFTIENSFMQCSILNKYGEKVFTEKGKLKYIGGKLYRLNLKNECFTLKSMRFNGYVWKKGEKKIVAYPRTDLYRVLDGAVDCCDLIEDIEDSLVFEECKLKVNGVWYNYDGTLIVDSQDEEISSTQGNRKLSILKDPLYAVRRQALLRAMGFFRLPVKLKDICRTISRTAWGEVIKEEVVKEFIQTIPEIDSIDNKYILRKK